MQLKIEKIKLKDLKIVNDILREVGLKPYPDFKIFIENSENFLCLKVILDEIIVGGVVLSIVGNESEIFDIFVSENYQKRGIGGKLLGEVEKILVERGVRKIFLEVRKSNKKAISFYEKNGFVKVGVRKKYYLSPVEDGFVFLKKLEI